MQIWIRLSWKISKWINLRTVINLLKKYEASNTIHTSIDGTQQGSFTTTDRAFDTYKVALKQQKMEMCKKRIGEMKLMVPF